MKRSAPESAVDSAAGGVDGGALADGDAEMKDAGGVPLQEVNAGETSFERMRRLGFAYVDKSLYAAELAKETSRVIFLRPRRFGKTLLLDTVQCLLERREELFRGLAVHAGTDWSEEAKVPVVRFDLSKLEATEGKEVFKDELRLHVRLNAAQLGVAAPERGEPGTMFMLLLGAVNAKYGKPAAVLIDEYDSPISRVLNKNGQQMNDNVQEIRDALHSFVNVLKSSMELTWCQLLTGVVKFVLSDMLSRANHFRDRSHDPALAAACGFTWDEVNAAYGPHISALATRLNTTPEAVRQRMDAMYNGWCFDGHRRVLNTWDVARCFQESKLQLWWLAEGMTSWLDRLMVTEIALQVVNGGVTVSELDPGVEADRGLFEAVRKKTVAEVTAAYRTLMQAGYLTVTGVGDGRMTLAPPNGHVRDALAMVVAKRLVDRDSPLVGAVKAAHEAGDIRALLEAQDRALNGTVYDHWKASKLEHMVQAMFALTLTLCNVPFVAEGTLRDGRCDFDIKLPDEASHAVIEMKVVPEGVREADENARADAIACSAEVRDQIQHYLHSLRQQRPGPRTCWSAVYSRRKGRLLAVHQFDQLS